MSPGGDDAGELREHAREARHCRQGLGADERRRLVHGEEPEIVLEEDQIVLRDLAVGDEELGNVGRAVEQRRDDLILALRPQGERQGGAPGDAVAAHKLRQAVGGPRREVLIDREGEGLAEVGQVADGFDAELLRPFAGHHDGVVVRETELAGHFQAQRIEQALHDLRRFLSVARRRLTEEDEPGAVVLGVDVDDPLLGGLEELIGRPEGDVALDHDALVLRELRDHLGEDHALGERLGADPQALRLLRTADEERAEHDGAQASERFVRHGRPPHALTRRCVPGMHRRRRARRFGASSPSDLPGSSGRTPPSAR